ncbi:related to molybdenum cofactor sulfurase HxB protein [Melanopsichium pennsylvanicum]|uniref:Molybdenum cofactor sulfurase n=2 Tax=Melanopsichium pennsylvanicum TaxID=63383 RepID=A0AAJ4XQG5_9BASI|nr:related to molybdenum cofactor sulfurase HxB protein [Melanopsichium pennsylvanicum 4]SNX86051.1 related to molybdenum cofactor sulfurase HxB protein [Melanopsichium pennsylvanicum]
MVQITPNVALAVILVGLASPYLAALISKLSVTIRVAVSVAAYLIISARLQQQSAKRFRVAQDKAPRKPTTTRDSILSSSFGGESDRSRQPATAASKVNKKPRSSPVPADCSTLAQSVSRLRRHQCPQLDDACYLDAAAAPPFPSGLLKAIADELSTKLLSNPHSKSPSAISTADQIAFTRLRVMREIFGIQDTHDWHLVFTSGTTAGLKLIGEAFDWTSLSESARGRAGFLYLLESHTSVVGIRDIAAQADVTSSCFTEQDDMASVGQEGIVVLPLQCNASGRRYGDLMKRVCRSKGEKALVMVDAASYLSSSQRLDLSRLRIDETPDIIAFSFYKLFGYPTGLGGLLVKASAAPRLSSKIYCGGGTVDAILAETRWTKPRKDFEARMEDGTLNVHGILAVNKALEYYHDAFGSWDSRGGYVAGLREKLVRAMQNLTHGNGRPVVRIYPAPDARGTDFGPIVNFNILTPQSSVVPSQEVDRLASISNIHLRMGRHCNPGFVTSQLGVTPDRLKQEYADGMGCDDAGDSTLEGSSTASASLRASLCILNTDEDIERLIGFIARFFLSSSPTFQRDAVKSQDAAERRYELSNITVYPIKSCAGQNLAPDEEWTLTRHGLEYDREWIVMNLANGKALSQKRLPKMALIRPRINLSSHLMTISIAGSSRTFTLDLHDDSQYLDEPSDAKHLEVCGVEVRPRAHKSDKLRMLLTNLLGVSCTLARQASDTSRHSKLDSGSEKIPLIFSNESPFLLINSASVDQVSEWMQADSLLSSPISNGEDLASDSGYSSASHLSREKDKRGVGTQAASFRANFLISPSEDGGGAFAEDGMNRVVLGGKHVFGVLGECRRCQMVCVDQMTGEVKPQTLKTLAKYRRNTKGRIIFGSHLAWLPDLTLCSNGREEDAKVWVGMEVVAS